MMNSEEIPPSLSTTVPSINPPIPHVYPAFSGYGIELEYMIVDRANLNVRPMADELLRLAAGQYVTDVERGDMGWSNELALHVFEIKNQRPQAGLAALAAAFQAEVRAANGLLEAADARLMPGGMHPWMDPGREARLWNRDNAALYRTYERIFGCRGHGWVNVQSMHLNLPFSNDLEFARLHAAARLVLPLLPALAASSPFAEGRYSGFMDYRLEAYRTHQMGIPATMGEIIPETTSSRADYEVRVLQPMYREIAPHDPEGELQNEWLNARGAIPRFGRDALEIRLLDVQECPQADIAIAAAVTALIRRLYQAGAAWLAQKEAKLGTRTLKDILLACIRGGEETVIDNPEYLTLLGLGGQAMQAREMWRELIESMLADGEMPAECHAPLGVILEHGPLARRLVEAVGLDDLKQSRLHGVYRDLCQCLQDGQMFQP